MSASPERDARVMLGAVLIVGALGAAMAAGGYQRLAGLWHDDSFFYVKTANNFAAGLGPTFDGINRTNGFHPLYFLLLAALAKVHPLVGGVGIVATVLLDLALFLVGLYFADGLLQRRGVSIAWRVMAGALLLTVVGLVDFGVEARLLVPLVIALMYFLDGLPRPSARQMFGLGLCGALVTLTRIDMISFVLLIFSLYYGLRLGARGDIKGGVGLAIVGVLPALIALGGFVSLNLFLFGHPFSVSSRLKTGFFDRTLSFWIFVASRGVTYRLAAVLVGSLLCLALALAVELRQKRRGLRQLSDQFWLLGSLLLFNMAYVVAIMALSLGVLGSWYFAVPLSILILSLTIVLFQLKSELAWIDHRRLVALGSAALVAVTLAFGVGIAARKFFSGLRFNDVLMGEWIAQNLPPDAVIFMVNNSGFEGYFSERSLINGDGLINSFEYQEYLRSGRLREFLLAKNVRYVLTEQFDPGAPLVILIRLRGWNEPASEWSFDEMPELVHRVDRFALFKIDGTNIARSSLSVR